MSNQLLMGHWAVKAAIKHQRDRDALYKLWNDTFDKLYPGVSPEHPELVKVQKQIDSLERDAVIVIHDLLFALGIYDKPMTR